MRLSARALVALTLALGACSTAPCPVVAPSSPRGPAASYRVADADLERGPRAVAAAEARADLAYAARVFDQAYAGVDGRERTPDPRSWREAEAWIAERERVEPRAFAELLRRLFWQPDGHLAIGWEGTSPHRFPMKHIALAQVTEPVVDRVDRTGAWLGRDRLVDCPPHELLQGPEGRYRLGVFAPALGGPLRCTVEGADGGRRELALGLSAAGSTSSGGDAAVKLEDGEVPVLELRTFDSSAHAALVELPAIARALRERAAFVVDLRGNTGGNYAYAEDFLLELTDAELMRLDEREVLSVAAAEGRANEVRRRLLRGDIPAEARPWFEAQRQRTEATAQRLRAEGADRVEVVVAGASVRGRAPSPVRARMVFLVDARCASACEMAVALARQLPGAVIAGQNTRGGMSAGEVAMFRLPHSGLTLTLGTRAFRDPLGDFRETRGFLPDVWLAGAELAQAQALAQLPYARPPRSAPKSLASRERR